LKIKEEKKMKVDLYIRVSTERQAKEGDSLEEQESELKKFCEYRGFKINRIYIERGKSGGNTNRPEYQKLIKDVEQKRIKAVIVKKLDRLSRSLLDFEQFMLVLQKNEMEFISLKENFDTTSAMGKAMLRVALVFAQLEREQTAERISDTMIYRASQGLYNGGLPPLGYTNINKELIPYPQEKQIVALIFKQFLDTKSTVATAKYLNQEGYEYRRKKIWDDRRIHYILQNPVYIGKVSWKGQIYQGIHQPIISKKMFQEVQTIFAAKNYVRARSKTNALLQRLLFCGCCNALMTTSYAINRSKTKYYYYKCTKRKKCQHKYIPFEATEQKVVELLLSLSSEQRFASLENRVLKHNQEIEQNLQNLKEEILLLETQSKDTKTKKDQYLDSLILNRFTSAEREKINQRIEEMELTEKQLKGKLYKQNFELTQKEEEKIDLTNLKTIFIRFKTDYDFFTHSQLREFLLNHIKKIVYYPDTIAVHFKLLPWPETFNC
jgi:site-specific DNA recombinase